MKIVKLIILIGCLSIGTQSLAGSTVLTVGDPLDIDCNFNNIQAALNSGELGMDIRVTNTIHTVGEINLSDKPVVFLRGGFNNCADANNNIYPPNPIYSTISNEQGYGIKLTVSNARQSNAVYTGLTGLEENVDLEISGFEIFNSDGGIQFQNFNDNQSYEVNLYSLNIHDNSDIGINFSGNNIIATLDTIQIHNNNNLIGGSTQGGGIRCFNSQLNLGTQTAIYNNTADLGGGIYAFNCQIDVSAGAPFSSELIETGINNNTANDFGGGMYLSNSSFNGLGQFDQPLSIVNNAAISAAFLGYGGAVFFNSGSVINLLNTKIEFNQASYRGSGIAGHHSNHSLSAPILTMGRDILGCSYASICSSLSDNQVLANSGIGATVYLRDGAITEINQTLIANNQAATNTLFYLSGALSRASLEGNLIYANNSNVAGDLAQTLFKLTGLSAAELSFNTIADNAVSTLFDLGFENNTTQGLEIYNSIISNAGSQIINHNTNDTSHHDANIDCSLLHDLSTGGIEGNGTQQGIPLFFGGTDYQLQENSMGIDPLCSEIISPEFNDLKGVNRLNDGAADLGAYESVVTDSIIFANGFEL